jgi:hypothetical protein
MILFFWYVSFVLSNFFLLLSFSLSYVPVTLTISFSSNRQVCIQTTRFFFLFQYAERSIILSLLFFCLSFHSIEKPSSKICFILTITHFLSLSFCSTMSFLFACRQHRESLIGYMLVLFLFVLIVPLPSRSNIAVLYLTHTKATSQKTWMMRMIIILFCVCLKIETTTKEKKIIHMCVSFRREKKKNE